MELISKAYAFNNCIESSLRAVILVLAAFPWSVDIEKLVFLDFLTVHSGDIPKDFDWKYVESLHAPVPTRFKEIFVRRGMIQEWLDICVKKWLVNKVFDDKFWVLYTATESAWPFVESLSGQYTKKLVERANRSWELFSSWESSKLKTLINWFSN